MRTCLVVSQCPGDTGGICGTGGFVDPGYYQLNNFDNILYSFNTLFDLLVVNNWFLIMQGHVNATQPIARLYFMAYYLFTVIVVTNVIIAFILDAFLKIYPLLEETGTVSRQSKVGVG